MREGLKKADQKWEKTQANITHLFVKNPVIDRQAADPEKPSGKTAATGSLGPCLEAESMAACTEASNMAVET